MPMGSDELTTENDIILISEHKVNVFGARWKGSYTTFYAVTFQKSRAFSPFAQVYPCVAHPFVP